MLFYHILALTLAFLLSFWLIRGVIRTAIEAALTKRSRKRLARKQSFVEWFSYKRYTDILNKSFLFWYYSNFAVYLALLVATVILNRFDLLVVSRCLLAAYFAANGTLLIISGLKYFYTRSA